MLEYIQQASITYEMPAPYKLACTHWRETHWRRQAGIDTPSSACRSREARRRSSLHNIWLLGGNSKAGKLCFSVTFIPWVFHLAYDINIFLKVNSERDFYSIFWCSNDLSTSRYLQQWYKVQIPGSALPNITVIKCEVEVLARWRYFILFSSRKLLCLAILRLIRIWM